MNGERAIEIHKKLLACARRQNTPKCNRNCLQCDLLLKQGEVQEALRTSIQVMRYVKNKQQEDQRT